MEPTLSPSKRQLKRIQEGRTGYLLKRPDAPKNDFTPRSVRRARLVGAVDGWRYVWTATRGYPALMVDFATRLAQTKHPDAAKTAAKLMEIAHGTAPTKQERVMARRILRAKQRLGDAYAGPLHIVGDIDA